MKTLAKLGLVLFTMGCACSEKTLEAEIRQPALAGQVSALPGESESLPKKRSPFWKRITLSADFNLDPNDTGSSLSYESEQEQSNKGDVFSVSIFIGNEREPVLSVRSDHVPLKVNPGAWQQSLASSMKPSTEQIESLGNSGPLGHGIKKYRAGEWTKMKLEDTFVRFILKARSPQTP